MEDLGHELGEALRNAMEEELQGIKVTVDAETEEAEDELDDLIAKREEATTPAEMTVTAETEEATADLDEIIAKKEEVTTPAEVEVEAETGEAVEALDAVTESEAATSEATADLRQNTDRLSMSVEALTDWIADLDEALASGSASADEQATAMSRVSMSASNVQGNLNDVVASTQAMTSSMVEGAGAADDEAESVAHLRDVLAQNVAATQAATAANDELNDSESSGGGGGGHHALLQGLLGVALALGPAFIGAAAGAALFVGAAIPDIDDLVHHTGPFKQDLAEIKAEYLQLSDAVKPEVITGFDEALDEAKQILPEFTSAAIAGGKGVDELIEQFGNFAQSGDTKQFLAFVSGETDSDMQAFGNLLQGLATLVYGFAESLNGISKTLINVAGGLASFGGEVLETVPWLGQWAAGVGLMYIAATKIPALLTKLAESNFAQWIAQDEEGLVALKVAFQTAAEEGTVFDGVMAATAAVNPLVWVAAAAVGAFALGNALDKVVGGQKEANYTVGDYIANLQKQEPLVEANTGALDKMTSSVAANAAEINQQNEVSSTSAEGMRILSQQQEAVANTSFAQAQAMGGASNAAFSLYLKADMAYGASYQLSQQSQNLSQNLGAVETHFGLSASGALNLANAAGVTSAQLEKSGTAGQQAANKVIQYGTAGAQAATATTQFAVDMANAANNALTLQARVQDLTTALNDESSGTDSAITNSVQFQQDLATLSTDMEASGNKAGYLTQKQQATAQALAQADEAAKEASEGILQTSGSATKAVGPLEQLRSEVEKLQDPTAAEKQLLQELNAEIAALHSKTVDIKVNVSGGSVNFQNPANQSLPGGYPGGTGAAGGTVIPGYAPGHDTVSMHLSPGEAVLVPELTRAIGAGNIMAMNRAFSAGRTSAMGHMAAGGIAGVSSTLGGSGGADEFNIFVSLLGDTDDYSTSYKGADDAEDLAQEFADATLKSVTEIRDMGTKAVDDLKDYYTGPHAAQLESALGKQTTALDGLAKQSANIASAISNAKQIVSSEKSSLASFSDLSNITGGTDANGNPLPVTGSEIQSGLQQDLSQLKQFFSAIKKLQKAKVAKTLIQQVIAMGPPSGTTYADAILSGGEALIKEINSIESSIGGEETKIGQESADVTYGLKIGSNIGKGFLSGLKKDKAELDDEMKKLGDEIADELGKALHGSVPTSVTKTVSALSSSATASAVTVGGTLATAKPVTHEDAQQIVGHLQTVSADTLKLASSVQANEIIALLKSAPKATGSAAGAAIADALNSSASAAMAKARASVRR